MIVGNINTKVVYSCLSKILRKNKDVQVWRANPTTVPLNLPLHPYTPPNLPPLSSTQPDIPPYTEEPQGIEFQSLQSNIVLKKSSHM